MSASDSGSFATVVDDLAQLKKLIAKIVPACQRPGLIIFLYGDLGVGKTELVRLWLELEHCHDTVSSPSFPVVNTYTFGEREACHIDCYRISSSSELTHLDVSFYIQHADITFVEWPEHGMQDLVKADLHIHLSMPEQETSSRHIRLDTTDDELKSVLCLCGLT